MRKDWIDFCRGVFMMLVFLYHAEVFYGEGHVWSWIFEPFFLTGFFFISGYLFAGDWQTFSAKRKFLGVVRGILVPYFLFMVAFLVPRIVLLHYDFRETLSDILLLRASWFVVALAVLELLYIATFQIRRTPRAVAAATLVFTAVGFGFVLFYRDLPDWFVANRFLHSSAMPGCLPACINQAFLAAPFFGIGLFFRRVEHRLPSARGWMLPVLIAAYAAAICLDRAFVHSGINFASCSCDNPLLVMAYFLLAMAVWVMATKRFSSVPAVNYIGRNSLLFYFLNVLMLRASGILLDFIVLHGTNWGGYLHKSYWTTCIVTLLAVALTFPAVWVIRRWFPFMAGDKKWWEKALARCHSARRRIFFNK